MVQDWCQSRGKSMMLIYANKVRGGKLHLYDGNDIQAVKSSLTLVKDVHFPQNLSLQTMHFGTTLFAHGTQNPIHWLATSSLIQHEHAHEQDWHKNVPQNPKWHCFKSLSRTASSQTSHCPSSNPMYSAIIWKLSLSVEDVAVLGCT